MTGTGDLLTVRSEGQGPAAPPALFVVGHGSRDQDGVDEFRHFVDVVRAEAKADAGRGLSTPDHIDAGFIEFASPDLDTGLDGIVATSQADHVIAVPLVLLGAGHMKNDGPAALDRARARHTATTFTYAPQLGIHPQVLTVAEERAKQAVADVAATLGTTIDGLDPDEIGVVLVSRGSTDPDANSDLAKVARLLADARGLPIVEPAYISLAQPSVPQALERCRRLGAKHLVTVPYFLFTGILVRRIADQAMAWAAEHPELTVRAGAHLGADPRIASVVLERHRNAGEGGGAMVNCDCCIYRTRLPGYEQRVGEAIRSHHDADHHHHDHQHDADHHHH